MLEWMKSDIPRHIYNYRAEAASELVEQDVLLLPTGILTLSAATDYTDKLISDPQVNLGISFELSAVFTSTVIRAICAYPDDPFNEVTNISLANKLQELLGHLPDIIAYTYGQRAFSELNKIAKNIHPTYHGIPLPLLTYQENADEGDGYTVSQTEFTKMAEDYERDLQRGKRLPKDTTFGCITLFFIKELSDMP